MLRFEVKVAVLWSISKIGTQNYDFFQSYVFPYASLCLKYYLDWIFDYFLLDWYLLFIADITQRFVSQDSLLLFLHDNFSNKSQFLVNLIVRQPCFRCKIGHFNLANCFFFWQNTFNIDLNYILKQFLAIFETFN